MTTPTQIPLVVRWRVVASGPCVYCGKRADLADHDVPVHRGGLDDESNLVPCCRSDNARKRSLTGAEYRALLAAEQLIKDIRSGAWTDSA